MTKRVRIWGCIFSILLIATIGAADHILNSTTIGRKISESTWGLSLLHYAKILDKGSRNAGEAFEQELLDKQQALFSTSPTVSVPSGIYSDEFEVSITLPANTNGYYSLDGSVPTHRHDHVDGPIRISDSTVLRVKAFGDETASETVTAEYVISELKSVTVAHLVLDPVFLFSKHAGIYSNPTQRGRAWERPAHFSLFEATTGKRLDTDVRVRIHGGTSRGQPNAGRKSLRISVTGSEARLGDWLPVPANSESPTQREWVLRHVDNKRQLWSDRVGTRLAREMGMVTGGIRPVILYLNGTQWGVYDLMERINEEFFKDRERGTSVSIVRGSPLASPLGKGKGYDEWNEIYRYVFENDMSDPDAYSVAAENIDIGSLIDYFILSIFLADSDRPHWNIDIFRVKRAPDHRTGKWKFAVWDFDGGLNYRGSFTDHDTLGWHLRNEIRSDLKIFGVPDDNILVSNTRLLRGLMQNVEFRRRFKARFLELLDTTLSEPNLVSTLQDIMNEYGDLVAFEKRRLDGSDKWLLEDIVFLHRGDPGFTYEKRMAEINDFISRRPSIVRRQLEQRFPEVAAPAG